MEPNIQRLLNDKLYDKRKTGALEYDFLIPYLLSTILTKSLRLERSIRELVVVKDYKRVSEILDQLCNDFAYAVHQPHARNGGLIGLAAAAIALGSVRYLISKHGSRDSHLIASFLNLRRLTLVSKGTAKIS